MSLIFETAAMQPVNPPSQFKMGCIKAAQVTLSVAVFAGGLKLFWDDCESQDAAYVAIHGPHAPLPGKNSASIMKVLGMFCLVGGGIGCCYSCCPLDTSERGEPPCRYGCCPKCGYCSERETYFHHEESLKDR